MSVPYIIHGCSQKLFGGSYVDMAITEKVQLLGAGLYKNIPDVLTLKSIPTASELDYIGSEDFDSTMLDSILPQVVEEDINFRDLLEIDYHWICRCLRLLNYGPICNTNVIFCQNCGETSRGSYQVDLRTVECKPLPEGFVNRVVVSKDEFLDFDGDIVLHLPTIQEILNAGKDKAFQDSQGRTNHEYARLCYCITSIKGRDTLNPFDVSMLLRRDLSSADFLILKRMANKLLDYGLRAGGVTQCPSCHSNDARFVSFVNERYFRPTLDDLRGWKRIKEAGGWDTKDLFRAPAGSVSKDIR